MANESSFTLATQEVRVGSNQKREPDGAKHRKLLDIIREVPEWCLGPKRPDPPSPECKSTFPSWYPYVVNGFKASE